MATLLSGMLVRGYLPPPPQIMLVKSGQLNPKLGTLTIPLIKTTKQRQQIDMYPFCNTLSDTMLKLSKNWSEFT